MTGALEGAPLLEVRGLNVWYGTPGQPPAHAVRDLDLTVQAGERLGLVGESGCGKSTAIHAIMGLLPPGAHVTGEVLLHGESVLIEGEQSARRFRWCDVAMVFQSAMNALNPVKRIGAQIVEPMEVHDTASGAAARERARELLDQVGLPPRTESRYPHELSGGMRQRAAIAMALACEPKLLLADEPTTALDVMVQAQIVDLLEDLAERLDLALVLVTHDLGLVADACPRAAVMYAGRIVESGPVATLFTAPRHPYTRLLLAATPDLHSEGAVASIPGVPPPLDDELVGCAFADRCDVAFGPCRDVMPALVRLAEGHEAACHRNDNSATAQPATPSPGSAARPEQPSSALP